MCTRMRTASPPWLPERGSRRANDPSPESDPMPLPLYDRPNWLFGLLVCGGWVAIGLGGYVAFHRVCGVEFAEREKNLVIAHLVAVGVLSGSLGLVFFFIAAMDRPFAGEESIGPEPIESTLLKMEQWDEDARTQRPAAPR